MAPHSNAILLISSPDRKGLVARISDVIYQHDGNILHADEHMDEEAKRFLMRMGWDLADFTLAREEIPSAFAPLAEELDLSWRSSSRTILPRPRSLSPRWTIACSTFS